MNENRLSRGEPTGPERQRAPINQANDNGVQSSVCGNAWLAADDLGDRNTAASSRQRQWQEAGGRKWILAITPSARFISVFDRFYVADPRTLAVQDHSVVRIVRSWERDEIGRVARTSLKSPLNVSLSSCYRPTEHNFVAWKWLTLKLRI